MRRNTVVTMPSLAMFVSVIMFAPSPAAPQEGSAPNANAAMSTTEYKPLTFWDRVRIGGAYYTDPSYIRTVRIAYGFNFTDIPKDQIDKLIKEGKVVPATVNPTTGNAVASDAPQTQGQVKPQGMVLLSASATLLGQPHSTVWLTHEK